MVRTFSSVRQWKVSRGLLPAGVVAVCLLCWGWYSLVRHDVASRAAAVEESFPIDGPFRIDVTGAENFWSLKYDSLKSPIVETGDAMSSLELHVPVRRPIQLMLHSTDYVYTLELPAFRLKEIAVPGLEFRLEFQVSEAGRFELLGDHLCGADFEVLHGVLIAQTPEQFRDWLRGRAAAMRPAH